jgi:hypothetical protein
MMEADRIVYKLFKFPFEFDVVLRHKQFKPNDFSIQSYDENPTREKKLLYPIFRERKKVESSLMSICCCVDETPTTQA